MPEVASRRHTELRQRGRRRGPVGGRRGLGPTSPPWPPPQGPGLIGALLVGLAAAKAIAYRARPAPGARSTTCRATSPRNYALGVRGAVRLSRRQRRAHAAGRGGGGGGVPRRRRTLDDAAGEAFDKGARLLGLRLPGRQGARPAGGARATRPACASRGPCPAAATSASAASRRRCCTTCASRAEARGRGAPRRHRRRLSGGHRAPAGRQDAGAAPRPRACGRVAVAGGVAANSGLRAALHAALRAREGLRALLPPLALCTDNAAMIGLAAGFLPAVPWPDYLALDAFASDSRGQGRAARSAVRAPPLPRRAGRGRSRASRAAPGHRSMRDRGRLLRLATTMAGTPQSGLDGETPQEPAARGRALRRCLENEGVEYVFGIPGEETLDLSEALEGSADDRRSSPCATSRARPSWPTRTAASPASPASAWRPWARAPPTWPPASPTPTWTRRPWWRSPARSSSPACTRRPISSSTWSRCCGP